jgi:hypothetical protein
MLGDVGDERQSLAEMARQVVVKRRSRAGRISRARSWRGSCRAAPVVVAGLAYISCTIGSRRLDQATETLTGRG